MLSTAASSPASGRRRERRGQPDDIGTCYRFQAHDQKSPDDTTPFRAQSGEYYSCFYFDVPWPEGTQAVSTRALDAPHAHHFSLYDATDPYVDGQITRQATDCGFQPRTCSRSTARTEPSATNAGRRRAATAGAGLGPRSAARGALLQSRRRGRRQRGRGAVQRTGAASARWPASRCSTSTVRNCRRGKRPTCRSCAARTFGGDIHVFRAFPHMHARGIVTRPRRSSARTARSSSSWMSHSTSTTNALRHATR